MILFLTGVVTVLLVELACVGIFCLVIAWRNYQLDKAIRHQQVLAQIMARVQTATPQPEPRVTQEVGVLFPGNNTMN